MAITRTAMVDDDGSGTTGTIINNAWKTELYNQIDGAIAPLGGAGWVDVAYSAANFTTDTGTWTVTAGNVVTYAYTVSGKTMILCLYLTATAPGGSPTQLRVALPGGFSYSARQMGTAAWFNNQESGGAQGLISAPTIYLLRDGAWKTIGTSIIGTFIIALN